MVYIGKKKLSESFKTNELCCLNESLDSKSLWWGNGDWVSIDSIRAFWSYIYSSITWKHISILSPLQWETGLNSWHVSLYVLISLDNLKVSPNVLPTPTFDSTQTFPSNVYTIIFVMYNPRPTPYVFIVSVSLRNPNSLKSLDWFSLEIPQPSSWTNISRYSSLSISTFEASILISPLFGVNFKALL